MGYKGVGPVCWGPGGKSYGRGAGNVLQCSSTEEENAALCYDPCSATFKGIGPVCWGQCPTGFHQCGADLCTPTVDECTDELKKIVGDVSSLAVKIANAFTGEINWAGIIASMGKVAQDLTKSTCGDVPVVKSQMSWLLEDQ